VFEHGLADGVADVLLAWVLAVLPLLLAAEVEQLGDVVQYQLSYGRSANQHVVTADQLN